MIKFMRRACAAVVLIVALMIAAYPCRAQDSKGPTVFAASSLKTALDSVAAQWTAQTGKTPIIAYGSSATLAKQIGQGAPADIFISADLTWMDYVQKAGLIRPGTRRNLLGNALVLVQPADMRSDLVIARGFDLAGATGGGKIAVCTIDVCPGGIYAKQSLQKLGIWAQVEPRLAQADTIRDALMLVARGEARFGIVYASDAIAEPRVKTVGAFPESAHDPIIYPVALMAGSKNPDAAGFAAWLSSPVAGRVWNAAGFKSLSK